ncbi:hypothetical protein [Chitinophaga flava]|nr:hypothetical protein [Chitinophaga flava]
MKKVKSSNLKTKGKQVLPANTNNWKKIITCTLAVVGIILLGVLGLMYDARISKEERESELAHINANFEYGTGIITDLKSYKGHSVHIQYKIGVNTYSQSTGWDTNPKQLKVGDSILFRYAVDSPQLIVSELQNAY